MANSSYLTSLDLQHVLVQIELLPLPGFVIFFSGQATIAGSKDQVDIVCFLHRK